MKKFILGLKAHPVWASMAAAVIGLVLLGSIAGGEEQPAESATSEVDSTESDDTTTTTDAAETTTPPAPTPTEAPPTTAAPTTTTAPPPPPPTTAPPPPPPPAASAAMPAVACGTNLQTAQNMVQDAGLFLSLSEDASGAGRNQIIDSNWTVVGQSPPPGTPIEEGDALFFVVKNEEFTGC